MILAKFALAFTKYKLDLFYSVNLLIWQLLIGHFLCARHPGRC